MLRIKILNKIAAVSQAACGLTAKSVSLMTMILACIVFRYVEPLAGPPDFPTDVAQALDKAGDNRSELELVIDHYRASGDSLKLRAAFYLISNMEGHSYMVFSLQDSAKKEIAFNVLDYPNYDSLLIAWDTLETQIHGLDFAKKELVDDLKTIKAAYLIDQIDFAFTAWMEKPWAKNLSFADFCEYVLPYRGSNEPLENWRQYFLDKYSDLASKMKNPDDRIEAAKLINNDIMTYFKFDPRFYYHPTDEGLSEMLGKHLGRCEDMTNITIYAMRANGLAVTSDYTPYWANSGNNHAWNSILTADGKVVPFMGAEANPGEYHLWNKLAKVYRKMYSKQNDNLIFQPRKQEKVPAWLAGKSYIDVTPDYIKTVDITVKLEEPTPDSVDIAYICVFNDGDWQPIHWGHINGDQVIFNAMGTDIAYLPVYFVNEDSITPASPPFILPDSGAKNELRDLPPESMKTIELFSTTGKDQAPSTDGIKKSSLTAGDSYELFFWENGWKSAGKGVGAEQPLTFLVPPHSLYWLVKDGGNKEERIFTIDKNGNQVWW